MDELMNLYLCSNTASSVVVSVHTEKAEINQHVIPVATHSHKGWMLALSRHAGQGYHLGIASFVQSLFLGGFTTAVTHVLVDIV